MVTKVLHCSGWPSQGFCCLQQKVSSAFLIDHSDAKNKSMLELVLYRLTLADGEQVQGYLTYGPAAHNSLARLMCPLKPTFPGKHHPLCTSPILFRWGPGIIRTAEQRVWLKFK